MTSASELLYRRRSRMGRDFELESFSITDPHLNYIIHRHNLGDRRGLRTAPCTTARSPPTRQHLRVHAAAPAPSDVGTSQLIPHDGANVENFRNTGGPRFTPNDRLPGDVLLARGRVRERLRGLVQSENRNNSRASFRIYDRERLSGNEFMAVDSRDWEAENFSVWSDGARVHIVSTMETERIQFFHGPFKTKPLGLTSEALELLQSEVFSSLDNDAKGEGVPHNSCDCSICLESFAEGDKLIRLPCGHRFHLACLKPWVRTCGNCPYCRKVISLSD